MSFENPGGQKNSEDGNERRRGGLLGLAVVGGLAASMAHHGQEISHINPDNPENYENSGVMSNEMPAPSREVMDVLGALDKEIGDSLSITFEQVNRIHSLVDDFAEKHPLYEGKTITKDDGATYTEASYSPYRELEDALVRGPNINPVVMGVMLAYIKDKTLVQQQYSPSVPTQEEIPIPEQ